MAKREIFRSITDKLKYRVTYQEDGSVQMEKFKDGAYLPPFFSTKAHIERMVKIKHFIQEK